MILDICSIDGWSDSVRFVTPFGHTVATTQNPQPRTQNPQHTLPPYPRGGQLVDTLCARDSSHRQFEMRLLANKALSNTCAVPPGRASLRSQVSHSAGRVCRRHSNSGCVCCVERLCSPTTCRIITIRLWCGRCVGSSCRSRNLESPLNKT